jgi:hypothetical protein
MSNVYCFWKGGAPPSPWAKRTYWDGSYIKLSNNIGNHGVTGGASNHTHPGSTNWSISTCGAGGDVVTSGSSQMMTPHTHSAPSSVNVSSANNDPSYYTLELIYADYDSWETTDRTLPQGAVILSQATITGWSSISRFTAADNRLIKLGTAGSTGGRDEHTHTVSGTLPSGGSSTGVVAPNMRTVTKYLAHTHTFSVTTAAKSIWPRHVKTRLYQVDFATDRVAEGTILFFDGTPSSNWEAATSTFNDCFLCSNDENPTVYGTSTHDHISITGTSSGYNPGTISPFGGLDVQGAVNPHSHTFSFALTSANHEPEYVYLVPYRLKNTLLHINVQDKTYSLGMVTKRVQDKAHGASIRMRAANAAIYTPDIVIKKVQALGYDTSMLLKQIYETSFDIDSRLLGRFWAQYKMGISLTYNAAAYGMTLRLVRPYGPNDTVINTLYHSWIDQLNKVSMRMDNMVLANRIEYARNVELDNRWGKVLDLPRLIDESDDHYRKRLQAATKILTGCGTKANCEEILSFLVDHPDSANIVQGKPGKVRIYWNTDEACRRGKELDDLVNRLVPKMLAAGIEYTIYHPFIDYQMGMALIGPIYAHYDMDMLLKKLNLDSSWTMRTRIVLQQASDYEMDLLLKKITDKPYYANLTLLASPDKPYQMDLLLVKAQSMDFEIDLLLRKLQSLNYNISMILQKRNISKAYAMDLLAKKTRRLFYSVNSTLKAVQSAGYGIDIKVVSI